MVPRTMEQMALLRVATASFSPADAEVLASRLTKGVKWNDLLGMAQRNRIFLQAYERISGALEGSGIAPDLARYRSAYLHQLSLQLKRRHEYLKVLERICGAGIRFAPFKGVLLDLAAYPPGTCREYSDFDLLMHSREDTLRAKAILEMMSYRKLASSSDAYHIKMIRQGGRGLELSVELHSRLPGASHLFEYPRIEGLWASIREFGSGSLKIPSLPPETMVIITCLNAFRDGEVTLRDIADIDAVASRYPNLGWRMLTELAASPAWWGMLAMPLLIYSNSMRMLGRSVPRDLRCFSSRLRFPDMAFPVPFSAFCGICNSPGRWCRGCPVNLHKKIPPSPESITAVDAFKSFPARVKFASEYIAVSVFRESGAFSALSCSASMLQYLKNITTFLLRTAVSGKRI